MSDRYEDARRIALAGARVIHVSSYEWERLDGWCIALARDLGVPASRWSYSEGIRDLKSADPTFPADEGVKDPLALLERFYESGTDGLLLMEDMHPYLDPRHHEVIRWVRQLCRMPNSPTKLLVITSPLPGLPMDLHKEVPTLTLPLPSVEDLDTAAQQVADDHRVEYEEDMALLDAARGLTVMEARLAFAQAIDAFGRLDGQAVVTVAREKERVIRQSQVLEYFEPDASMEQVGGLETLKEWLERRGRAFGPGATEFGLDAPRGTLLLGVQGCGKSLVAKAIASQWQFPLLRFDLGKVFGGIVGESEGNIRGALQLAQALAPCVLWIDEIEKGLAGLGSSDRSDGGTTARVVGTFLTWMQEKSEPVFVVATANRIDMLPPELLRKGRFDELFFVDLPTEAVRGEILQIHLAKKRQAVEDFDVAHLARSSAGFSGAELEEAVREGLFGAFAEGRPLKTEDIETAIRSTYPLSRTMHDEIVDLRAWARARAKPAAGGEPEALAGLADPSVPRLRQESANPFVPPAAS